MNRVNRIFQGLVSSAASWSASILAVVAVLVLGKTSQAMGETADSGQGTILKKQVIDDGLSYVQVGDVDQDGGPNPPKNE
jgi:hypothetical protein